jgi:acetyl-CoA C-acetyltransferase
LNKVALVSMGYSGFSTVTPQLSFKEMMFEAANMAYAQAGIEPRSEVDSFICCEEDLLEGISITDEYMPDQLGGAQRALCTISQDGLNGVIQAYMQIASGIADIVVVESHVKFSNVLSKRDLHSLAMDPYLERPFLGDGAPLVALEMRRYMHENGVSEESIAQVVVKNKTNGLKNPRSSYAANLTVDEVMRSEELWSPLKRSYVAQPADACVVAVLASYSKAKSISEQPVWIEGVGWFSESSWIGLRDFSRALYAEGASKMAYKMAKIENPSRAFDFVEVDDSIAFKELQHLEALGIYQKGKAAEATLKGETKEDGSMPVNPSGGSLSVGNLAETSGLARLLEAFELLKKKGYSRALVQSWRGVPTSTASVVVLGV